MSNAIYTDFLKTARMQAKLARVLYRGRDSAYQFAKDCGNARFRWIESSYATAVMLGFPDHVHISVLGSNDPHDWVQNFSASIDYRDDAPMHSGFRKSAEMLYQALVRADGLRLTTGRRVYLGGHSCGGAIAQAMSTQAVAEYIHPTEVYTFGSPRVFTPELAARASAGPPTYRFTMPGDPVPHMPLRQFRKLFGGAKYSHFGMQMELYDDGDVITEQTNSIVCRLAKGIGIAGAWSLFTLTPWRLIPVLARKHGINRYIDALDNSISKAAK